MKIFFKGVNLEELKKVPLSFDISLSKYRTFSGPYFPVFALNKHSVTVQIRKRTDQKKTQYLDTFRVV